MNKVKEYINKPETVKRRYIRELQSGMLDYNRLKKETIEKYNIKYNPDINTYY